jgi:hypothetical protein
VSGELDDQRDDSDREGQNVRCLEDVGNNFSFRLGREVFADKYTGSDSESEGNNEDEFEDTEGSEGNNDGGREDIRRNNLDPGNVLSALLVGDVVVMSVDTVGTVSSVVVVAVGIVVEVPVVVDVVSGLHVSLPQIDKAVDEEKRGDGSEDEFSDCIVSYCIVEQRSS